MDSCVLSTVLNINPVSKDGIPLGAADWNLEIISSQRTCSWLFLQAFLLPLGDTSLSKPLRGSSATSLYCERAQKGQQMVVTSRPR